MKYGGAMHHQGFEKENKELATETLVHSIAQLTP